MVFTRGKRHEGAYVGYLNRLACEVIVPGPRVLESGNHAEFTHAEIGDHHGIHAAAVEVQALAIAAHIPIVIGALERIGVVHFELAQAGNDLVDAVPIGVVAVIPAHGFGFRAAVVADGHAVTAGVDAVIVPEFFKLPEQLRTGQQDVEALNGFLARKGRVEIGHLVGAFAIAVLQSLVHQAFFVMALRVGDDARVRHALVLVARPGKIGWVPHGGFVVLMCHIRPHHESIVHQGLVFGQVHPVFQHHVNVGCILPEVVGVFIEQIDAGLVVAPHVAGGLGHAFGKVEAVAVDVVFINPIFQGAFHEILRGGTVVVPIEEPRFRTGRNFIEPRVVRSRLEGRSIPVHLQKRIRVIGMVEHHIEEHCNAAFVASIDQLLER